MTKQKLVEFKNNNLKHQGLVIAESANVLVIETSSGIQMIERHQAKDVLHFDRSDIDARDQEILSLARAKYPRAKSDLMALVKWMTRSSDHGLSADKSQDVKIANIEKRLDKLEQQVSSNDGKTQRRLD